MSWSFWRKQKLGEIDKTDELEEMKPNKSWKR